MRLKHGFVMNYAISDNEGFQAVDQACVAGGPAAYFNTLPLRAILDALRRAGIPAYLSPTAGTYLCNFALYTTVHALAARPRPARAGFIHFPLLPSMVAPGNAQQPSMDLGVMLRGVELALETLADSP